MRASSYAYRGRAWIGPLGVIFLGVALATSAGCHLPAAATDWPASETVGELRIGQPVKHDNLTIFPVYARTAKNDDRFITLDEGLKAGTVEIMETGAAEANLGVGQGNPDGIIDEGGPVTAVEPAPAASEPADETVAEAKPNVPRADPFGEDAPNQADDDATEKPALPNFEAVVDLVQSTVAPQTGGESTTPEDIFADPAGGQIVDGDVNRLMVVNRSDKPLYLMPGEVIIGGKQDRTIGEEIVIAPTKKPVPIDAFCVEHGRWNERGVAGLTTLASGTTTLHSWIESSTIATEASAAQVADGAEPEIPHGGGNRIYFSAVAEKADRGQFIAPAGALSSKARLSVVGTGEQGAVWDEVAKVNAATGNDKTADTGGFTGNYFDPEVLKKIEPYVAKLNAPIAGTDRVVGVVVAIDGKFVTMDVFESTPLFAKLWPKLLKSYALDAAIAKLEKAEAEQGDAESAKPATTRTLKIADARTFLADALHSSAKETTTEDGIVMTKREGEYCVSFSAHREEQLPFVTSVIPVVDVPTYSAERGAAYGGQGAGVHTSAFGK